MNAPQSFGSLLRELRLARGLTQRDLAEKVGIDPTYLSKLETGAEVLRGYAASFALLVRLARQLHTDTDELLFSAGRVPEGVARMLVESEGARRFYRTAAGLRLAEGDWRRLSGELDRIVGDR